MNFDQKRSFCSLLTKMFSPKMSLKLLQDINITGLSDPNSTKGTGGSLISDCKDYLNVVL